MGNVVKIVNSVWVACENIRFSIGEERGETDVFAGYVWVKPLTNTAVGLANNGFRINCNESLP